MTKYILPILAMAALPVHAQLNNTVEVTNEVKPLVKDADKINMFPSALDTPVKKTSVQYLQQSQPLTEFASEPLRDYTGSALLKGNKRGYLHLGGGTHGQLDTKAAYQFDLTKDDFFNIDFTLKGYNGKTLSDKSGSDFTSRMYRNRAAAQYDHVFGSGLDMYVKGAFENHVFNYQSSLLGLSAVAPGGTWTDKQHNVLGSFAAGITPYETDNLTLTAEAGVDFFSQNYKTNLADKYGETILRADVTGKYKFSKEHQVEAGVELFNSTYAMDGVDGITHLHLTPHYIFNGEKLRVQLGVVAGSDGDIAPDVRFAYHVAPHSDFYVNAIGYDRDNDFRRLSGITPYFMLDGGMSGISAATPVKLDAEFHKLDASVGYRFGNLAVGEDCKLSADVNTGYDLADGCPVIDNSGSALGLPVALVRFCETKRFYVNADLTFAYKDKLKVDLKNQYNSLKYKSDDMTDWASGSYINPAIDLNWTVDVKIVNNLFAGVNWELGCYDNPDSKSAPTGAFGGTSVGALYERPTTNNLGLSLRYTLPVNTPMSVFVKGDNLLGQKFDQYFGYRAIGANVIAGVAVSF